MKFIFKILPLLTIILFISLICFGAKRLFALVDESEAASNLSAVTENYQYDNDKETFDPNESLADVSDLRTKSSLNKEINNESDFDEDFSVDEINSPEESLDAELEGKSSNQLITVSKIKALAQKSNKTPKNKIKTEGSKEKKRASSKTTINKKPRKEKLVAKGNVPASYDVATKGQQFLVIGGSFKSKSNANTFIAELEKKGMRNIEILEMKNKTLNRVCISRHSTYEAAKKVTNQLRKQHKLDTYVHRKMD